MGLSPVLALLLPMSVVIGAIVYFATGNALFALLAFALDAIPVSIIYMAQLKKQRVAKNVAQDRLQRYSSLPDDR